MTWFNQFITQLANWIINLFKDVFLGFLITEKKF